MFIMIKMEFVMRDICRNTVQCHANQEEQYNSFLLAKLQKSMDKIFIIDQEVFPQHFCSDNLKISRFDMKNTIFEFHCADLSQRHSSINYEYLINLSS